MESGLKDAECFIIPIHPVFIGKLGGEPIGCITAIAYDETLVSLSVLVKRGFGAWGMASPLGNGDGISGV